MKAKLNTLIVIILIAILVIGVLIWWNYKKTIDRKYQACLDKCRVSYGYFEDRIDRMACEAECREKYGK